MDKSWRIGWRRFFVHRIEDHFEIGFSVALRPLAWVLGMGIDITDSFGARDYRIVFGIGPFHFGPMLTLPLDYEYPEMEDY